jgi:hypothetical protein
LGQAQRGAQEAWGWGCKGCSDWFQASNHGMGPKHKPHHLPTPSKVFRDALAREGLGSKLKTLNFFVDLCCGHAMLNESAQSK